MSSDTVSDAPPGLSGQAFTSLFQAVAGLRNGRAVVAMLGCTFVGVLVSGLFLATTPMLGFLAGLLAFPLFDPVREALPEDSDRGDQQTIH